MFRSTYKNLPEHKEATLTAQLPPVFCSALSASVRLDESERASEAKIVFSALSSAIMDQRREQELAIRRAREKRLKPVKYNCGAGANPAAAAGKEEGNARRRRRHPAGDQKLAKEVDLVEEGVEPLVGLRIQSEDTVELRTLLEDAFETSSLCSVTCLVPPEDGVIRQTPGAVASKLRKVALNPTHVMKKLDNLEDSPDGFVRGFKSIINKIFSL